MEENNNLPRMMSIREISRTGLLPEHCLRVLVKEGKAPFIMAGNKTLINYDKLVQQLQEL